MKKYLLFAVTIFLFLFVSCGGGSSQETTTPAPTTTTKSPVTTTTKDPATTTKTDPTTTTVQKYTVTFDADNGSKNVLVDVEAGNRLTKPTEPTKDGYSFEGWFLSEGIIPFDFSTIITENITLKAHWNEIILVYKILGTECCVSSVSEAAKIMEKIEVPAKVTIDGMTYNVTSIGNYAFDGCNELKSIKLPNSIKSLGDYSFNNCTKLTNINLPSGVISLGKYVFYNCSSLTNIIIPNSITSIGLGAFKGCSSLESITLPFTGDKRHEPTDTYQYPFGYIFGTYYYSGETLTYQHYYGSSTQYSESSIYISIPESLKEVIITDVTYLPYGTFSGCNNLTSIMLPNSITSIGGGAFFQCDSLMNVYYNGTIEEWLNIAFNDGYANPIYYGYSNPLHYASNLYVLDENGDVEYNANKYNLINHGNELILSNDTTSIGKYAFLGWRNLAKITIPNSVTSVGEGAFSGCSSLETIILPFTGDKRHELSDTYQYPFGYIFGHCSYDGGKAIKQSLYKSSTLDTEISTYYIPISLKEVIIEDMAYIPCGAFGNLDNIVSIKMQKNVKNIGESAFKNCKSLTNVYYNGTIEDWINISFSNDYSNPLYYATNQYILDEKGDIEYNGDTYSSLNHITKVVLSKSIENLSKGVLRGFSLLESITLPFIGGSNEENQYLGYIFGAKSYVPASLKEIVILDSCTNIGSNAFSGCSNLINISLPSSITSIANYAFLDCNNLTNVYYNGTIEDWCNMSFGDQISNPMYYASNFYILDNNGDIEYNGNKYSLLTELVIPDTITKIGNCQFFGFKQLINISIPNSVLSVGNSAFIRCSNLENIIIPNSVTSIAEGAFSGCTLLESITVPFVGNNLSNNNYLGYFFGDISNLKNNSYVPESLKEVIVTNATSISSSAFENCSNLTNIIINSGVETIGSYSFRNCTNLKNIIIPNSVTNIGKSAFSGCSSLESISLPFVGDKRHESTDTYQYPFGYIFGTSSYTGGIKIEQPYYASSTSSTTIATYYIPSLKEVTITDESYIPYRAFCNCNIPSIILPDSLTYLGDKAFDSCSLNKITISSGLIYIGDRAFNNCSILKDVYYNGTIEEWCNISFANEYSNPMYYASNFYILDNNGDIEYNGNKYSLLTELVIPDTITEIGNYQFYKFNCLTSAIVPESVKSIGEGAFHGCNNLTNVYYNGTIEDWCNISFCSSTSNPMYYASNFYVLDDNGDIEYNGNKYSLLTDLVIPDTITKIESYRFAGLTCLVNIIIHKNMTSISNYAFNGCTNLTNVYYYGTIEDWFNIKFSDFYSNPMYYASNFYILDDNGDIEYNGNKYSLLTELVIPDTITEIGNYHFIRFNCLTSIVIPNEVTSIAEGAFSGCTSLESITLPFTGDKRHESTDKYQYPFGYIFGTSSYTGSTAIEQYYRGSTTSSTTKTKYYIPSTLKEVIITDMAYIPYGTFYNCSSLTNITIQSSTTSIGGNAFYNCSNITNIIIPDSVTTLANGILNGCSSLETITIPFIGDKRYESTDENQPSFGYIFDNNKPTKLKEVTITDSTYIQPKAFYGYSDITTISFSTSVTGIGSEAFYGCSNLKNIVIPNGVTSISNYAFNGCNNLTNVYYNGTIKDWCNISFGSSSSNPMSYASNFYILDDNGDIEYNGNKYSLLTELVIPDTITSIGDCQFYGFNCLTSIVIPNEVTSIAEGAFSWCTSLESITLPFTGDKRHKSTDTNQYPFGYIFGKYSYTGGRETVQNYYGSSTSNTTSSTYYIPSKLKEVILIDTKYIPYGTFSNCSSLTSITIPNSVTSLEDSIFSGCRKLTNITISNSVTSIGNNAFYYCISLTSIIIPNSVKSIGNNAFYNCSNLTSITVPNSVTSIGLGAFSRCSALESISLPFTGDKRHKLTDTYQYPFGYIFGTSSYSTDIQTTQFYYGSSTSNTTSTEYLIPSSLRKVIITLQTYIPYGAFSNCNNLTSIIIKNNVKTIEDSAFDGCINLTSIVLPSSINSIGSSAFSNCANLTSIYYGGAAEQYAALSNKPSTGIVYYYSEIEPAEAGNYWHYDTDGVTPVVWAQNA